MAKHVTGRVEVMVNGITLLNKEGAKAIGIGRLHGAPTERTAIIGDTGWHGVVSKYTEAACEVTITDRDDVSLEALEAIEGDGTIVFRTYGGGKTYAMNEASCAAPIEVTAGEGDTTIRFIGPKWIEGVSAS